DGALTTTKTFVLTVTPVNDLPTISNIPNQSTLEDTATSAIGFDIGDVETPASGLVLTVTSSNETLVPVANVVLSGADAHRTVVVTPASNQNGMTVITVTVSDGTATASDAFVLTVVADNDPPTISDVTDQTTPEDTATAALPFTVGDVESLPE